jgi:hypothetical protein
VTARARAWRELKPFVGPAVLVALYALLRLVHTAVAGDSGIITPSGSVDRSLVILTYATFVFRLAVLVLVPFFVVYRLVMRVQRGWSRGPAPSP